MGNRLKKFVPIAEIASAIAVVLSLIFVGLEIRNSTDQAILSARSLEISAYQELHDNISEFSLLALQNPEILELRMKARANFDELTEVEQDRVNQFLFVRFRHGDMAYFQYERGAIDEARLRSSLAPLITELHYRYVRNRWLVVQGNFVESYRTYMNSLIDEIPVDGAVE